MYKIQKTTTSADRTSGVDAINEGHDQRRETIQGYRVFDVPDLTGQPASGDTFYPLIEFACADRTHRPHWTRYYRVEVAPGCARCVESREALDCDDQWVMVKAARSTHLIAYAPSVKDPCAADGEMQMILHIRESQHWELLYALRLTIRENPSAKWAYVERLTPQELRGVSV